MKKLLVLIIFTLCASPALASTVWEIADGGNGNEYEFYTSPTVMNWTTARNLAESMGGHLVTITSEAENNFLKTTFTPYSNIWIGLYQPTGPEPAGGWVWVTGEPVTFTDWYSGEPNEYENYEDYGSVSQYGKWFDITHGGQRWYPPYTMIVEYEYIPEPDPEPEAESVPEPTTIVLFVSSALGLLARRKK